MKIVQALILYDFLIDPASFVAVADLCFTISLNGVSRKQYLHRRLFATQDE
jgi:hypothetical protein